MKTIRIILVNTSHPGNIGSAARAMKTMGLEELYIVAPKRYPAMEATMMAAGADDILEKAKLVDTLDEALKDCQLILGTSARDRSLPWPMQWPHEAGEKIAENCDKKKIAVLFGREDKGLKNEELQRCHYHIQIPANPDYTSLNLAQAVQVIAYEIRKNFLKVEPAPKGYDTELADQHMMELLFQHLEQMLYDVEFLDPKTPNRVMPRLRRLLNRSEPDTTEVNILRGMLTEIQKKLKLEKT